MTAKNKAIQVSIWSHCEKASNGYFYTGGIIECGVNGGRTAYKVICEENGDTEVMLEEDWSPVVVWKKNTM